MRLRAISRVPLLVTTAVIACSTGGINDGLPGGGGSIGISGTAGASVGPKGGGTATGGATAFGGNPSSSGGSASGGSASGVTGGALSLGGSFMSGGISASGGNASQGGSMATGGNVGKGGVGQGGSTAQGGGAGKGGTASKGGSSSQGGSTGQGGNVGKGGSTGKGGSAGKGGTPGSGGLTGAGGGSGGTTQGCAAPQGSSQGHTTRFWDCCKPSCGWNGTGSGNVPTGRNPARSCNQQNQSVGATEQSACTGGGAHACWDMSPWAVSDTLAYGFAAFNSGACGQCYELRFTGQSNSVSNEPGSAALCGKRMIVQVVNIGSIGAGQFDLMIPGGGVGDFNACSSQWGVSGSALGERYGGVMLACQGQNNDYQARRSCTLAACSTLFSNSSHAGLRAGCNWQVDWLAAADNPRIAYQQVACPSEITSKSGLQ